ncbi:MAG: DUF5654 family protein [Candidatus Taylorbacteria bacterium]|nr:DUF5654 family protein [Candidatus Taylorbacteria bacterium]
MDNNLGKESEIEKFLEKYELRKFHYDFVERMIILIIAGLGLITALAWDDAFKDIFRIIFGSISDWQSKLIYAVILTTFTVFITVRLNKIVKKRKK